jgi:hypothetical protein
LRCGFARRCKHALASGQSCARLFQFPAAGSFGSHPCGPFAAIAPETLAREAMNGLDARRAAVVLRRTGLQCLQYKGFSSSCPCPSCATATCAERTRTRTLPLRPSFPDGACGVRFGGESSREAESRRAASPGRRSTPEMKLVENSVTDQRLGMKVRSRLRVICATPFQKRPVGARSERFLCCVCRCVQ